MTRKGSAVQRLRLQTPGRPVFEVSLGTRDEREAEIIAYRDYGDKIAEHKAALLARRPHTETAWRRELEPGLHDTPNGKIFATATELHHLDAEGRTVRTVPNGRERTDFIAVPSRLGINVPIAIGEATAAADFTGPAVKSADDTIIDTYLKHAGITGYSAKEAWDIFALFKRLTNNKPLSRCTRDDGRALVRYMQEQNPKIKRGTIQKKLTWLVAAANLAIEEGKLTLNPFAKVLPKKKPGDVMKRLPFDDAEMATIRGKLDKLDTQDQLLVRFLATTGARLGEAYQVESEHVEGGCRYVVCGSKTEASLRRVPLPAGLLPHLPKRITGPLFTGKANAASRRLARFLSDIGITDPRKVAHSWRHRAADRLRAAGCPKDMREALLGHGKRTISDNYGEGFPVPLLREWIDRIGF
jgi:integrase